MNKLGEGSRKRNTPSSDWLINTDPLKLTVKADGGRIRTMQRFALLTLWFSTNGPQWNNNNGWLSDRDECNWYGIVCDQKLVASINELEGNNLMGTLPADLALLTTCTNIHLGLNPSITVNHETHN